MNFERVCTAKYRLVFLKPTIHQICPLKTEACCVYLDGRDTKYEIRLYRGIKYCALLMGYLLNTY